MTEEHDLFTLAYVRQSIREWRPTPRGIAMLVAAALSLIALILMIVLLIILMMDSNGESAVDTAGIEPLLVINGPGVGEQPVFDHPSGVDFGPDGSIYVADSGNDRIVVFDSEGKYVRQFGGIGVSKPLPGVRETWKPGLLSYPVDVVVDERGRTFVADFYNDSISLFDKDGSYITRFPDPPEVTGKGGSGQEGRGIAVTAIDVVGTRVFATDAYQVFEFQDNGKLVRQFGMPGTQRGGIDHPNGIAADAMGRVYLSDSNNNRIQAFEADGRVTWVLGERQSELKGESDQPIALPRGMTLQVDGVLLVADPIGQRLVKVSQDGRVLASYGTQGQAKGQLSFPNDVAVNAGRVVIADTANNRVQVVRLKGASR